MQASAHTKSSITGKLIAVLLGGLAVLGVIAVADVGGSEPRAISEVATELREAGGGPSRHAGHPVAGTDGKRAAAAAAAPKLRYSNSKNYTVAAMTATDEFWMGCPRGWKAIGGYFGPKQPGVVLANSDPNKNASRWYFQLLNLNSSVDVRYYTGIICVKGFR
jgi:hypothetical protein